MKEPISTDNIESLPDDQFQIIVKNGDDILIYQVGDDDVIVKTEEVDHEIIYDDNLTYDVEYTIKEEEVHLTDSQESQDHDYVTGIPYEVKEEQVIECEPIKTLPAVEVQRLPDQDSMIYVLPMNDTAKEYMLDTPCIEIKDEGYDDISTEELLRQHLESQHGQELEELYQCNKCDKVYPNKKSFNQHQNKVHGKRKSMTQEERQKYKEHYRKVCETCGKAYYSRAALMYHQRVHTGERPYKCTICPKAFTMPLFLQIHLRTHTGERPYPCAQCPKAFSNQAALMRHHRVHTGVKPYPCPQCGKCFTQSNSMKLHVRTVHMKLPAPYKRNKRRVKQEPIHDQQFDE